MKMSCSQNRFLFALSLKRSLSPTISTEVMEQIHGYDYKADMWSLGITALELAKGYAPYAKYPPMKVLILTIQEEPPTLDTYDYDETDDDNEEDDYPQEWSSNFTQLISWLLQKDPAQRPTCQQLLQSPLLATAVSQETLEAEICAIVPDVGGDGAAATASASTDPGHAPVWIETAEDRPAGTTWVFADGSQVLASDAKEKEVDDVLSEFDQFCGETGGENYTSNKKDEEATPVATQHKQAAAAEQDDLDDFLDEFENLTAGENFQRS
jgi:serine/threonine-protein kinase OSR1/STK39